MQSYRRHLFEHFELRSYERAAGDAPAPNLVLLALKSDHNYRLHNDFEASFSLLQALLLGATLRRFVPVGLSLRTQIMQTHEADVVVAMTGTLAEGLPVWFLRHGAVLVQIGQYVLSGQYVLITLHLS